jgi:broad specificity phosphatase PhoE
VKTGEPTTPRSRFLYLIRHGQYIPQPDAPLGGPLTPIGRDQARRVGRRFAGVDIASITSSDMPRAIETATLVAGELGVGAPRVVSIAMLREQMPTRVPGYRVSIANRSAAKRSIDRIVARMFRRPRTNRHEIVVCHGNLIRALVCRALGVRLTAWADMDTHNGGVTTIRIRGDGRIRVVGFNDTGHLPPHLVTES